MKKLLILLFVSLFSISCTKETKEFSNADLKFLKKKMSSTDNFSKMYTRKELLLINEKTNLKISVSFVENFFDMKDKVLNSPNSFILVTPRDLGFIKKVSHDEILKEAQARGYILCASSHSVIRISELISAQDELREYSKIGVLIPMQPRPALHFEEEENLFIFPALQIHEGQTYLTTCFSNDRSRDWSLDSGWIFLK